MPVTVRRADLEDDALAIMDGARDFISRMDYSELLPETDDEIIAQVGHLVSVPGVEILVAEDEGEVVGGIGMLYSPFLWNSRLCSAEQLFVWTADHAPPVALFKLLRAVQRRMTEHGVEVANFKAKVSHPTFDKVLLRMGLRPVETVYIGAPKPCQ